MEAFFKHIDSRQEELIKRLAEAVAIPSVSGEPERRSECVRMVEWTRDWAVRLGGDAKLHDIGTHTHASGVVLPLPPILTVEFRSKKAGPLKTVCVYGHLDVQPAEKSDGWNTEPFVLTEAANGALYGRGSSDDKGPVLSWLWAIEALQQLNMDLPVNIKMCLECMEESGSEGLEEFVFAQAKPGMFLSDVDAFCISDNYWLSTTKPCVTYGLRGLAYFLVEVEGGSKDLHSGVFGGVVHEATIDLVKLLASVADTKGNILIEGVNETVRPLTDEEARRYDNIDFDTETFRQEAGAVGHLMRDSKHKVLMHRWRYPSISIHGIEGAYSGAGAKTVIPRKVIGKFSIRLVPDMDPVKVGELVKAHLEREFAKLGSSNKLSIAMEHPGKPFLSDPNHPNYRAARNAIQAVYGIEPDLTCEGGSIPISLTFQEATGKNLVLLPIGRSDDGAHSQNEKLDRTNYINGVKLLGAYFDELSRLL
eukprot:m.107056 g.107056  ORF g.107056 m.107056 type:complete len:478 (-) comp15828_c0_seq4:1717-3150(-)